MKVKLINENFTDNYTDNLLKSRGIVDLNAFKTPQKINVQDPMFLDNIKRGVELLKHIIMVKGRILLVVDCDVDGVTSSAIIYQYIKSIMPDIIIDYVMHEGKQHGLQDHIETILKDDIKYDLIIQPDSGSNDEEYHNLLKELGTQILVIDHHELDESSGISDNAVIINNQLSSKYENKQLTGAGVAYQFCKYFDYEFGYNNADDFIDLAALGIIGDMGSLAELENRYIIKEGMKFPCKNEFLNTIIRKQAYSITGTSGAFDDEINEKINPTAIAFYIVPLINAMIRSGTLEEKNRMFEAFINPNKLVVSKKRGANGALEKICIESVRECVNAKSRQDKTKLSMAEKLEIKIHKNGWLDNKVLFVILDDDDDFPPELNGLVCMQLCAKFKKPTIVARLNDEGFLRGSARGPSDTELIDFKQLLLDSNLFEYAQGHALAFGISININNLDRFHDYANEKLKDIDFGEGYYEVNFTRPANAVDLDKLIFDIGSHVDYWGQNMKEPLIYIPNIKLTSKDWTVMGSKKDTIKFEKNGVSYIKFRCGDLAQEFGCAENIDVSVIGRMSINEWCGTQKPQIIIENVEIKDDKFSF